MVEPPSRASRPRAAVGRAAAVEASNSPRHSSAADRGARRRPGDAAQRGLSSSARCSAPAAHMRRSSSRSSCDQAPRIFGAASEAEARPPRARKTHVDVFSWTDIEPLQASEAAFTPRSRCLRMRSRWSLLASTLSRTPPRAAAEREALGPARRPPSPRRRRARAAMSTRPRRVLDALAPLPRGGRSHGKCWRRRGFDRHAAVEPRGGRGGGGDTMAHGAAVGRVAASPATRSRLLKLTSCSSAASSAPIGRGHAVLAGRCARQEGRAAGCRVCIRLGGGLPTTRRLARRPPALAEWPCTASGCRRRRGRTRRAPARARRTARRGEPEPFGEQ